MEKKFAPMTTEWINNVVYGMKTLEEKKESLLEFINSMVGRPQRIQQLRDQVEKAKNIDAIHMMIYNIKLSENSDTRMGHVVDYKTGTGKSFKQNRKEYFDNEKYKKENK